MIGSGKRGFSFVIFLILGIILVAAFSVAAPAPACPAIPVSVVKNAQEEAWALRVQGKLADHGTAFKIERSPDFVEFVPKEKGAKVSPLPSSRPQSVRPLTPRERSMIGFVETSGLSVDYKNAWNAAKADKDVKIKRYGDYYRAKYSGDNAYLADGILAEARPEFAARIDAIADEFNALPLAERQKRVDEFIGRMEEVIQGKGAKAASPRVVSPGIAAANRAALGNLIVEHPRIAGAIEKMPLPLQCKV